MEQFPHRTCRVFQAKLPRQCSCWGPGLVSSPRPGQSRGGRHRVWAREASVLWAQGWGVRPVGQGHPLPYGMDWSRLLASRGACGAAAGHSGPAAWLGACGGQADGMGSGQGPGGWRVSWGRAFSSRGVSVGVGPGRPVCSWVVRQWGGRRCVLHLRCIYSPAQPLPTPPPTASRETPGLSWSVLTL